MTSTAPISIRTSSAGEIVVSTAKHVAKRHPGKVGLWVLGLMIAILASGFKPSPESIQRYTERLSFDRSGGIAAQNTYFDKDLLYRESQGFLWSCRTDECRNNREEALQAKKELDEEYLEYKRKIIMANKEVGLFSTYGVREARDLFWSQAAGGKQFAKRATMWDAIFIGIRSMGRDDSLMEWVIRVFFQLLMNLTMGIIVALIGFLWSIWEVILAYGANPWAAVIFFTCCLVCVELIIFHHPFNILKFNSAVQYIHIPLNHLTLPLSGSS
eukprot:97806_1